MVGLLGCECTLPGLVKLFIHQYPQVLLGRAALSPFMPLPDSILRNEMLGQITDHRMVGVGRDLCGSSSPTPLPKQGHLQQLHRNLSRRVLNISTEGDSTSSLRSLFQCSVTLRGKKFFLMFRRNFLCFGLCPLPLVLSLATTEKSLAPSS